MAQLIEVDKNKCNLSYTCVRVCPAKAIKISGKHAEIMPERCVGCGNCVTVCSQEAIFYRSDKRKVQDLILAESKVAVICDPAISGEFIDVTDYRKFVGMLRALGFDYVTDMSFGVDLVACKNKALIDQSEGKFFITSKCPTIVKYIEKQEPELIENLMPVIPPYIAMAKVVRKKYGENIKLVYLTACTAAKDDVKSFNGTDGQIESVLTFTELRALFAEKMITESSVAFSEFDPPFGKKGGLFPISHGMFQAVDIHQSLLEANILITEGRDNFLQALKEFKGDLQLNEHLDLFYCKGCIMGPGMSKSGKKYLRRSRVIKFVEKRMKAFDEIAWKKERDSFADLDLSRSYRIKDLRLPMPTEEQVEGVLRDMGKTKVKDMLGCGACGYSTCKEFAIAHWQGLTTYEQCYTYSNKKLQSVVVDMNVANKELRHAQLALKESEKLAKQEELAAKESAEVLTIMLNKLRAGVVIVDENLKVIESNARFVDMMGEDAREIAEVIPGLKSADLPSLVEFHRLFASVLKSGQDVINRDEKFGDSILNVSVFTIKKNEIVGGIIRDLETPEVRREEIINRARSVIRENLETVQQIAFLLGESASKTEKTLNSIIEAQKLGEHGGGK